MPHVVNVFPHRDFVSAEGYKPFETVTVEIEHPGITPTVVGTVQATADATGLVEVNHPRRRVLDRHHARHPRR